MDNNVVFVETTDGYPRKFTANNSKVELIAEGLKKAGDNVTIINKLQGSEFVQSDVETGNNNGLIYYTFRRYDHEKCGLIKNLIRQCKLLKSLKCKDKKNVIIMGQPYYLLFLLEIICYRAIGYMVGVTKTEWPSKIATKSKIKTFDYWIFDNSFGFFVNIIFPISGYIEQRCRKFRCPMFKVPILARFNGDSGTNTQDYFLLCSTLAYKENVKIVIDAFALFVEKTQSEHYSLKLVLSGSSDDLLLINKYIEERGITGKTKIYCQIPFAQLMELYNNARGLLIPLQDTIQDKARFSQKIAEYVSTGNPIITNSIGDIRLYFKDKDNAYIAKSYDKESYAEIMVEISRNQHQAKTIGHNGYLTGLKNFDNTNVCKRLSQFLTYNL